ncbi:MAG: DMT family transporter [Alcanivoracaceae bacterium]|nr:DMT family transporter [Alcanivoracaceae bacterium]
MPVGLAYLIVVLVWATTPLAIKWSAETFMPVTAVMLRMMLAVAVGLPWLWLLGQRLRWDRLAIKSYAAALPGVFGAMSLSYLASVYVASGLISVMFGLAPLLSGFMLQLLPNPVRLNLWHWAGCVTGVGGLALVFADALQGGNQLIGILLLLGAVTGFSVGGIAVKQVAAGLGPLPQTLGSLILSLPCFWVLWFVMGESFTVGDAMQGVWAVLYLALCGSLVGFVCYFKVLSSLPAATVALITLITPVLALLLGALFNGEQPGMNVITGALVILFGLALYFLGDRHTRAVLSGAAGH